MLLSVIQVIHVIVIFKQASSYSQFNLLIGKLTYDGKKILQTNYNYLINVNLFNLFGFIFTWTISKIYSCSYKNQFSSQVCLERAHPAFLTT